MQVQTFIKIYGWLILLLVHLAANAQISSKEAHYTDTTKYTSDTIQHLIFVYTTERGNYPPEPVLTASLSGIDSLNFHWIRFSDNVGFVNESIHEDINVEQSEIKITQSGGYKVQIYNNEIDTVLFCWVNITAFEIAEIRIQESTCDFMELRTSLNFNDEYRYFDLQDSSELIQLHTYAVEKWDVEPEGPVLPKVINPQFDAPVEYTRFTLNLIDNFGLKRTSYLDIEEEELNRQDIFLKATKADFNAVRADDVLPDNESDTSGQAPLIVQYENISKNGVNFEWTFYYEQSRIIAGADSVMETSDYEIPVDSIRYIRPGLDGPGLYDVKLISYGPVYEGIDGSNEQCVDVLLKEEYIEVDSVSVPKFANVFTPPGEPNAVFHFENAFSGNFDGARSVKSFSLKIYSRWGDKVYEYEGDINEWQGWDGTTLGNIVAKTGVYFYSAFIEGWDGKDHNKKGYIHLFRDDN